MNQYILIKHVKVQNANAVAGFTWGFPAITHFLGFIHNLSRKMADSDQFQDIILSGCAVIAHEHKVHTYGNNELRFVQSRTPPYLPSHNKTSTPPVIEEGKMNMTVSLLIGCDGNIGNREDEFCQWLKNTCFLQRLAGGTILKIASIRIYKPKNTGDVRAIVRELLPGFVLQDRSQYLEDHYQELRDKNPDAELIDAWFDFSMLTQKARPKSDLITKHLLKNIESNQDDDQTIQLATAWQQHLEEPYNEGIVPNEVKEYFNNLADNKSYKKLLAQWNNYCTPNEKTDADWRYIPKPETGYLVPIMTGYKAISQIYKNDEVGSTRDNETDVCFVESVHSIGEWQSVHRVKTEGQLQSCLWHYHYEPDWYLCKQSVEPPANVTGDHISVEEESEENIFH